MISSLEVLSTEILFEIFDYLTTFDIFYALINLNRRINDIVGLYSLQLDFQQISRSKFDFICRHIQPKQVISIYFSDELMPDQDVIDDKLDSRQFPSIGGQRNLATSYAVQRNPTAQIDNLNHVQNGFIQQLNTSSEQSTQAPAIKLDKL
ncbi:unnamed protein product [Rotaria sp. Silwood1]|nr:unnamed protein product [Rotaria sp. Silwood1]